MHSCTSPRWTARARSALLGGLTLGLVAAAPPADRSWSEGSPGSLMAETLQPNAPVPLELPASVASRVTGPTALFYFSPACPHCQAVMPEVNRIAPLSGMTWIGVASGRSDAEQVEAFKATYHADFEMIVDTDSAFGMAVGARSTPSVYVARPYTPPPEGAEGEAVEGEAAGPANPNVEIVDAYLPFGRGAGGVLLMRSHPDEPFRDFVGYQTDSVCSTCHMVEYYSWATTHHAVAYRSLYEDERAQDLQCVGCHVTGYEQPGGFEVGDHGSPLASVSCEACHGPSGPHDGERMDARTACQGCHDPDHSINFSVDKGLPHIDHYLANTLDDDRLMERVMAVSEGRANKPLLAFGTGDNVGSDACKSCHKAEFKAHKKGPHGTAMARLEGSDLTNVECLRCHATAVSTGPPPDEASGFRTGDSVGCESCHGPGSAHVEAPSAGNIVGLGTTCPECVLEAICTSCHTPRWDPRWELRERLRGLSH